MFKVNYISRFKDLENLAAQSDFWDNQENAQKILQQLNDLKFSQQQHQKWQKDLEDVKIIIELLELETDEALFSEAQGNLSYIQQELDRWELQKLLSGPYDAKGAVLTINAGAGGTDAQDWVEILLRMYTRWAEKHRSIFTSTRKLEVSKKLENLSP